MTLGTAHFRLGTHYALLSQLNFSKLRSCPAQQLPRRRTVTWALTRLPCCSLLSVPMNSTTHEWEITDPSLGAGLKIGPSGATVLTRDPTKGQEDYEQSLRVGPDGVVVGPNTTSARVNRTADLAQGTLGVNNVHIGPSGVLINNGSPLNSSVKVAGLALIVCGSSIWPGHHFHLHDVRAGDQ